ncbi:MAG: FtsX-like permease family protein [Candidatus Aminicenantes bacterium]|nr:FtsX-like permease family protein [Candidatus Aminicenantes bacterium]
MAIVAFIENDASEENINAIRIRLENSPYIEEVHYITSQKAKENFSHKFPELRSIVENLEFNPFPASIEAVAKDNALSLEETIDFVNEIKNITGVDDVQFNKDWLERIQAFSRLAKIVGFFLGGILVLASFFIISNIIKLNVLARKEEIEILRLTGATNLFIRTPFLIEGMVLGLLGSSLSLLLLAIIIHIFPLYLGSSLGALSELIRFRFLSVGQCFGVLISGCVTGFIGSYSSLARFLNI